MNMAYCIDERKIIFKWKIMRYTLSELEYFCQVLQ